MPRSKQFSESVISTPERASPERKNYETPGNIIGGSDRTNINANKNSALPTHMQKLEEFQKKKSYSGFESGSHKVYEKAMS